MPVNIQACLVRELGEHVVAERRLTDWRAEAWHRGERLDAEGLRPRASRRRP